MPIWLRRFTFEMLREHYEKQAEENKKLENQVNNGKNKNDIARPNIAPKKPTYTAKVPHK